MTTDPIAAYQDARTSFDTATAEAEQIVGIVVDGAMKLENRGWRHVGIANVGVSGFPPGGPGTPTITGDRWPTGVQLAEKLSAWHAARTAMRAAYQAIPPESRAVVVPPPED